MPRTTPCLNYSSRSAAVRALYAKGLSWNEIADLTGIDKRSVASYMPRKRKDDRWKHSLSVRIPAYLLPVLAAEAEKRDLTPTGLVRAIVTAAVDEALIPAILDDQ